MQCDVCGREISGKPHRVIIEGAKMVTCDECSRLGSEYWEPEPKIIRPKTPSGKVAGTAKPAVRVAQTSSARASRSASIDVSGGMEVVEGFGLIVKRARERMGLTPEELGRRIGEKESVIKKIESEKIIPDIRLASKLEHALKIRILTMPAETAESVGIPSEAKINRAITLGEIVQLRDRRRRENEGDNSLSKGSI
ncbi:MAG: multiprotein bridging factor aMBF1 [Candidatus Bathyarchaeia archaeon]|nr:TIGR00270 family protein [Candidatus Bathyarchaeota archaeon]